MPTLKKCWNYWVENFTNAKERGEALSGFGAGCLTVAVMLFQWFGVRTDSLQEFAGSDAPIMIGSVSAALSFTLLFLWIPYKRHAELSARLENHLSFSDYSGLINKTWSPFFTTVTNRSPDRTARNLRIEFEESPEAEAGGAIVWPIALLSDADYLHAGQSTRSYLTIAGYGSSQTLLGNGEILKKPHVTLAFGPNDERAYLSYEIGKTYRLKLRAMAEDMPETESWFTLHLKSVTDTSWQVELHNEHKTPEA